MIHVIGSGPAAISAVAALVAAGHRVVVLDAGMRLQEQNEALRQRLELSEPEDWDPSDLNRLKSATQATVDGVQLKRAYGSDYAYADVPTTRVLRQQRARMHRSFALGGLSNVWGGCVLPYPESELASWPIAAKSLSPHYQAVSELMPKSPVNRNGDELGDDQSMLSQQARVLHESLVRNREKLAKRGIRFGVSQLAADFSGNHYPSRGGCRKCGLCLYGCPYRLIYSTAETLQRFQEEGTVEYISGVQVERILNAEGKVKLIGRETDTGQVRQFDATRVFIGAGVIETTRLMLESMDRLNHTVAVKHSDKFVLPLLQYRATKGVTNERLHTLSQMFLEINDPQVEHNTVHLQAYTYNDLFLRALQRKTGRLFPILRFPIRKLLERLVVCFGYLHSDVSSRVMMTLRSNKSDVVELVGRPNDKTPEIVRRITNTLRRAHRHIGAFPIRSVIGIPGEGNHCGGTFPMSDAPTDFETDTLGRLSAFPRVHLVDASVFPSLSATTITLTAMANAHRIATESTCLN